MEAAESFEPITKARTAAEMLSAAAQSFDYNGHLQSGLSGSLNGRTSGGGCYSAQLSNFFEFHWSNQWLTSASVI